MIKAPITRSLRFVQGVRAVRSNLSALDEIRGLFQGLCQFCLLLVRQGELEAATLKVIQERGVCYPIF